MAWTQTDIDALKAAMALGALTVSYPGGTSVTYRSQRDMERQLLLMQAEASGASSAVPIRQIRMRTSKGI